MKKHRIFALILLAFAIFYGGTIATLNYFTPSVIEEPVAPTVQANNQNKQIQQRLKELGYLGPDGTVIGIEGGDNPYTLDVSPSIIQWSYQTDETKDNVTVNISVTSKNNQK